MWVPIATGLRYCVGMAGELEELAEATAQWHATKAAHDASIEKVRLAVIKARKADHSPTEVRKHSPYTDTEIRKISRGAGIEPDPRYVRKPKD